MSRERDKEKNDTFLISLVGCDGSAGVLGRGLEDEDAEDEIFLLAIVSREDSIFLNIERLLSEFSLSKLIS